MFVCAQETERKRKRVCLRPDSTIIKSKSHLQNWKRIFSKTRTGPVLPRMISGWPPNREKATPVSDAPSRDSMAL